MKSFTLLLAGFQMVTGAAIADVTGNEATDSTSGLELSGIFDSTYGQPGHQLTANDGTVPSGTFLEPSIEKDKPATPGAKVTVLKYGPYRVPAMGSLENRPSLGLQKPCSSCYIVAMQANLINTSGKTVNIDEGAWLHHMVMYNNGLGRRDAICAMDPQRIFASGNERTPVRTNGKYKVGIEIGPADSIGMLYDLMNESKQAQTYNIEMVNTSYEWLPMTTPGYKAVKMAWLDITGCGTSDYPAKVGNYEVKSPAWRTSFSGRLVSATGHEHDGGSEVNIYKNGKSVCNSAQIYGRKPAWVGGMEGLKIAHISDTGSCVDFGDLKIGDSLAIGAKYNTTAHSLNKKMSGAGNSPIMGIAQVYIA